MILLYPQFVLTMLVTCPAAAIITSVCHEDDVCVASLDCVSHLIDLWPFSLSSISTYSRPFRLIHRRCKPNATRNWKVVLETPLSDPWYILLPKIKFQWPHLTGLATSSIIDLSLWVPSPPKGQIISKCLFGVFNFFQKTNKNTSHSSKNEFIRSFFGRIHGLTICFRN